MIELRTLTAAILLSSLDTSCAEWVQLGDDLDGENERDFFGGANGAIAMSKDGKVLAVGAPGNDDSGADAGHVRIFDLSAGVWKQRGSAIAGEAAGDGSGRTVAINFDGDIVAIGASNNQANDPETAYRTNYGHVRVYQWHSQSRTCGQLGQDIDGEGRYDFLSGMGRAIAMSANGHTMAIGAYGNNNEAGADAGHVRVYDFNLLQGWVQRGFGINGERGSWIRGDWFGCAVAISDDGNALAAGAMFNHAKEYDSRSGHVRVFDWLGGSWTQRGDDIDGERYDFSGSAVAMSSSGDSIAVGSPRTTDTVETLPGRVRVYDWTGRSWLQRGSIISGEDLKDKFGSTLDMNAGGNSVCVGAYLNDAPIDTEGHVRCFDWDGRNWVQRGAAIEGENRFDYSGYSVAMDASGDLVASGARYTADAGYMAGHVRVFRWQTQSSTTTKAPPVTDSTTTESLTSTETQLPTTLESTTSAQGGPTCGPITAEDMSRLEAAGFSPRRCHAHRR